MRIPLKIKTKRGNVSTLMSRPAPVLGWNARDSIADMKPEEAIELENLFPAAADVMLRKGKQSWVTGITGQVESLMSYNTKAGTQTLFAAATTKIYDVTSSGAVGAAVVSSLTNARWQHINYTNSSGDHYLCCFNGADSPRYWNGTAWTAITGVSTPAITGLTTSDIIAATVHMRRIWLVQKASLKAWYLPVDAVGGAAVALDLSGVAKKGGYLMAAESWTMDSGAGLDDYLVFVTSEGEVVVYQGTDPASATTWGIKGVWSLGEPIGRRCIRKFGGDLLLILKDGVFQLSKALVTAAVDSRVAITNRIEQAMNYAAINYAANYGWQIAHYPAASMVLLNVPVTEGADQEQYVMNSITGAWCKFTGWEGNCFEVSGAELYMGGNGTVYKVWNSYDDDDANIFGMARTAFDYFKTRNKKSWKMARPIISASGTPSVSVGLNVDYDESNTATAVTFSPITAALWGVSAWGVALWATGLQRLKNWIGLSGVGLCASTRMRIAAQNIEVRWQATDYLYEPGDGMV